MFETHHSLIVSAFKTGTVPFLIQKILSLKKKCFIKAIQITIFPTNVVWLQKAILNYYILFFSAYQVLRNHMSFNYNSFKIGSAFSLSRLGKNKFLIMISIPTDLKGRVKIYVSHLEFITKQSRLTNYCKYELWRSMKK